jgi:hypothetical protein
MNLTQTSVTTGICDGGRLPRESSPEHGDERKRENMNSIDIILSTMARAVEPSKPSPPKRRKRRHYQRGYHPALMLSLTRVPPEEGISQIPGNMQRETSQVIDDTNGGSDD